GRGGGRGSQGGGNSGNAGDFLVNQQGGISKTHALGLNYSNTWGTKTDVQGSYFFNLSDNTSATSLLRRYVPTTTQPQDLRYAEDSRASSRNINNRFNLRLDHKFDSLNSLLWRPSFSMQRNTGNSLLDGSTFVAAPDGAGATTAQGANASSYRSALTGISGSSQLLYRRRFALRGRTFSAGFNAGYNDNRGDNNLLSSTTFYRQQQPVTSTLNQFSELTQTGWNWRGSLDYTEPLGQNGAVQVEYDIAYTPNKSDKRTYDFVPGEQQYSRLNDTLSSVFQSSYLTNSGELSYRYQNKELQWSVGAELQHARLNSDQEFPRPGDTRRTFLNLLPNARFRYNFSKQQNLRINYRTSTNAPSVSQLQEVVNNANPLQLTTGNPNLRQESRQNLFVRYSSAVPEKSRSFFAFLGGSYVSNYITNNTIYASGEPLTVDGIVIPAGGQLTRPVNLNQQYSVRSFANYSQPLALIKSNLSLNAGVNYAQTPGLVFGELNYNRTPSASLGASLSSNISTEVDFTLASNSSQSWVRNSLQPQLNNRFFSQNTSLRLSWIIAKGITLKSDVNHRLYSGLEAGFNQNFVLWNASLGKKIFANQQGEIQVFALDLLGQNNSIQRNIAAAYTEDVQTNILQRYFLLSFTYNIRSFGSGASGGADREGRDNGDGQRPRGGRPEGGGGRPGGF
ncbi:TonB-dependent receptor, partial [Hymenobacter lapidiphilus]|uniref:outer membrane beta-barrel protein n=1 Tax=Hymenobacter sp. CCM 8763 TaxID=2303334 RepID=UPI000E35147A